MMKNIIRILFCIGAFIVMYTGNAYALKNGEANNLSTMVDVSATYTVVPDITYLKADGVDLKLDIYAPKANVDIPVLDLPKNPEKKRSVPTVIFFHGGGWVSRSKETSVLQLLPYLEKGWTAVNVEYRLNSTALAPAAVEDTRCAVWWVKHNAKKYGFDPERIILSGRSAGGHLALITGMLPTSAGLDSRCPIEASNGVLPELEVAAIVNWAGITDVSDLIEGESMQTYASMWVGSQKNRQSIAKQVSPLTYVRKDLPPIITVHGNQDTVVPYGHAVLLHKKLDKKGVPNQLHTITDKAHFDFSLDDIREAFTTIDAFLALHIRGI